MTKATLGRLWSRYLRLREELAGESDEAAARSQSLKRHQADHLRDRLVVNYSPLVKYVAGRVAARTAGASEMEDLISWGIVGLLDAIETFDPARPSRFESYAISKIRWAILDEMRRMDWVPRRARTRAQEAERATAKLTQSLGCTPTEAEVAGELGITLEEYRRFRSLYSRAQMASLEARLDAESPLSGLHEVVSDRADDPQRAAEMNALRGQLVQAIEDLEERERLVATFYFYEGLTLKEIGKALDLTEGRISQILRCALAKLRKSLMEGEALPEDL